MIKRLFYISSIGNNTALFNVAKISDTFVFLFVLVCFTITLYFYDKAELFLFTSFFSTKDQLFISFIV